MIRPRLHWIDQVEDDLRRLRDRAKIEGAENREVWRAFVEADLMWSVK